MLRRGARTAAVAVRRHRRACRMPPPAASSACRAPPPTDDLEDRGTPRGYGGAPSLPRPNGVQQHGGAAGRIPPSVRAYCSLAPSAGGAISPPNVCLACPPAVPARQQRRTKVFVSRYNTTLNLSHEDIMNYINQQMPHLTSSDFAIRGQHVVMKVCPFCVASKPHSDYDDPSNQCKLHVLAGNGVYICHRCDARGSWYDLKRELGGFAVEGVKESAASGGNGDGGGGGGNSGNFAGAHRAAPAPAPKRAEEPLAMPPRRLNSVHAAQLFAPGPDGKECEALRYLTETRGLTRPVLRKYGVGRATYSFPDKSGGRLSYVPSECVTFPWIMREAEVAEQEEMRGGRYGGWSKPAGDGAAEGRPTADGNGEGAAPPRRRRGRPRKRSQADEEIETIERFRADGTPEETPPEKSDEEVQAEAEASMGPFVTRRIKVRSITNKSYQRLDPPGGGQGLFGWHTVPPTATSVVLTEGEFDAMAVCQATGRPAVSLPNGCRSLPVQAVQMLERFDTIVLWMDSDGPGREGAEMFARKLGVERCLVVRPSGKRGRREGEEEGGVSPSAEVPKDANEALLGGWDLDELIEEATNLPHERILRFADVRDQVLHEIIHPDKYRGTPMTSLPGFTSLIKGFRRGELTVLTGPTGSGKTTFLGQTSLDLVEQGVNVLWGSFEIKNTRLMKKLLQQYMRDVLPMADHGAEMTERQREEAMTSLSALADRFEDLPMYFMKFHGGSDVDDVIDAMEYSAYVHDVEHIILDNMQFMISRQNTPRGSSFDKFDMQDVAIEKFRKFATQHNVHVTLVVHPRKEEEGSKLGISSFYGSAKATQEADTVLILQSDGKRKFVDVRKNRYDGTLGHVPLYFQRKSGRYTETPPEVGPPRTVVPRGVSALNGTKATASASVY